MPTFRGTMYKLRRDCNDVYESGVEACAKTERVIKRVFECHRDKQEKRWYKRINTTNEPMAVGWYTRSFRLGT